MASEVRISGLQGLPDITPGTVLAQVIVETAQAQDLTFISGDILVVTQKIVSKAEGQLVDLHTVTPSPFAVQVAKVQEKDPQIVEVVLRESRRVVRMAQRTIIAETHHGFICAHAGVDESNVAGEGPWPYCQWIPMPRRASCDRTFTSARG
jgi:coenzyme F420-0:L-glutamate ligase/coenzyme F420-1:gamma-L-glutamate ligase